MRIANNHYERYKLRHAGRVMAHKIVAYQATHFFKCTKLQVHVCPRLIVLGDGIDNKWCAWSISLPPNVVTNELNKYDKEGQEAKAI